MGASLMTLRSQKMMGKLPKPEKTAKVIMVLFVMSLMLLSVIPWQQFALGDGKVIAFSPTDRLHTVNAPVGGRIKKWYVDEGMRVKPGDPIVDINDNDPELLSRLELEKKAVLLKIAAATQAMAAGQSNIDRQHRLYTDSTGRQARHAN